MKLNVGGGSIATPMAEWVSTDLYAWPTSVQADARRLPFRSDLFERVHCSHMVEHVPFTDAPRLLAEIRRVLRPDGIAYVAAPDNDRCVAAGSDTWVARSHHGGRQIGWDHKWVCTAKRLRKMLFDVGLVPRWTTGVPQGHPVNTHAWPTDFEARFVCRRDDWPWPDHLGAGVTVIL